jgi:hypothetical protein
VAYSLEVLGDEKFQELAQALLVRAYPGVQCFPVGQADGGRDALRLASGKDVPKVFQVKFTQDSSSVPDPVTWLLASIRSELPKIVELAARGIGEYCLITNVSGSGALDVGQRDRLAREVAKIVPIPTEVWWREEVERHLDGAWDVKWSYPEVMSTSDLLRYVLESGLTEDKDRRTRAILAHVADQHGRDQDVRFKQVELQNRLLDLFIDVPVGIAPSHGTGSRRAKASAILGAIAGDGEISLDFGDGARDDEFGAPGQAAPLGAATLLLDRRAQEHLSMVVLEGAPGQGKSTVVQYVCQVHRIRLLNLVDELAKVPEANRSGAVRLPLKVDLRDFAKWLTRKNPFGGFDENDIPPDWRPTLESFLAAQIAHSSGGARFDVADLQAISSVSALTIVLDGLDEVADIDLRTTVVAQIEDATRRLKQVAAALQVIVTSRPASFANSPGLADRLFSYCQLADLPRTVIDEYVSRWLSVSGVEGRDAEEFRRTLGQRLELPHLRELARNPMQLAILLSLVRARGESLPEKRTALYDLYVDLFLDREAEKSEIVRRNRELLKAIHQYLGWTLQSEAQVPGGNGAIQQERLKSLVRAYLEERGHDVLLVDQLFQGITERVVALVARIEGTFEFEVQPLREYFAARYLYETAPYSPPGQEHGGTRPDRLAALIQDAYWLNVARFYGGCHSVGELPGVADGLEGSIRSSPLSMSRHPRALAAMLLGDWVFAQDPRSRLRVAEAVFGDPGWRILIARDRLHPSVGEIRIPETEGGSYLLHRALEAVSRPLNDDYVRDVCVLLKSNFSASTLSAAWSAYRETAASWWSTGARMGALGPLKGSAIHGLLSGREPRGEEVLSLLADGHSATVESDERWARLALDQVLDGANVSVAPDNGSVIGAVSWLFEIAPYATLYHFDDVRSTVAAATAIVNSDLPGSVSGECRTVLAEIAQAKPSPHMRISADGWRGVLDAADQIWPRRWAVQRLALYVGRIPMPKYPGIRSSLFDADIRMYDRVRYARTQSSNLRYWREQFAGRDRTERRFALAALIVYGSPAALLALGPELDAIADSLDEGDVDRLILLSRLQGPDWPARKDRVGLRLEAGYRQAALLWPRANEHSRIAYRRKLIGYEGADRSIRGIAGTEALRLGLAAQLDWPAVLDVVRSAYLSGSVAVLPETLRSARPRLASGAPVIPHSARLSVLSDPENYPSALVSVVESMHRETILADVETVPVRAARGGWFATI